MNILPRTMDVLARTLGLALLLAWTAPASAQETQRISLNGPWLFAVDPVERGVELGWHLPGDVDETIGAIGAGKNWDRVTVPHAWPADPRYQHTGTAWYRRPLEVPEEAAGQRVRLAFEAVFYRTRVFVDGQFAGRHEGGYTPFTLDITPYVEPGQTHTLAVEVDNRWDLTTIPGARPGGEPGHQLYPWWDYGGIVRDVDLLIHPPLYVEKQKVEAEPDLDSGTADVRVTAWVANATSDVREGTLCLELYREGEDADLLGTADSADVRQAFTVMPHDAAPVRFRTTLPDSLVALWHPDAPHLYQARVVLEGEEADVRHAHAATFGIRKVETHGARLLLNGEPIRLGGANRHIDHPRFGLAEPDSLIDLDMGMMAEANMMLSRLHHYPPAPGIYDWADRNGHLLIAEAGNWQLAERQMDDPVMRAKFEAQMREMVERDWNHPSVIGWSVGNEYPSDTPAGLRWTRDMAAFTRGLDSTRLVTFAALGGTLGPEPGPPEAKSSHYVDLVMVNLYNDPEALGRRLDRAHALWPEKPIYVSEFGRRADVASEAEQAAHVRGVADVLRTRPFAVGAGVWTFNDYRSRYPNTNPNGYRPWGLVDPDRQPRPGYGAFREAFSPAVLEATVEGDTLRVQVANRDDFPRYTLREYRVRARWTGADGERLGEAEQPVGTLRPGERGEVAFAVPSGHAEQARVEVLRPGGFSIIDEAVPLQ